MSAAVRLRGTGKRYWQLHEQPMLVKALVPGRRTRRSELWALRSIDLEVEEGSTVGIVGHNGAGKTTLLRLLAGVTRPSEGRVEVSGRVAPLIGVGVGFHQELSGRENVLVNGMLLGLTRRDVESRFDDIVAFAELESFIDTPVKFYSSGMFLRLGFSVAVHVRPAVLLVDEVLAVGDLGFQRKCFDRMKSVQADGTTVLVVSHSMDAIRLLCPRAVLLRHGRLEIDGPAEKVIARHHELLSAGPDQENDQPPVTVLERSLEAGGREAHYCDPGAPATYRARLRFDRRVDSPLFFFRVTSDDGTVCYQMETVINRHWGVVEPGYEVRLEVPFSVRLAGGSYRAGLIVSDRTARLPLLSDTEGLTFFVGPRPGAVGIADLDARIVVDGRVLSDPQS